jgi:glycine dehydrogenase
MWWWRWWWCLLLLQVLNGGKAAPFTAESLAASVEGRLGGFARRSPFLQQQIFNSYHW